MCKVINSPFSQLAAQPGKGLDRAGTELWDSQPLSQCMMAPPLKKESSEEYPLSGALDPGND